MAMKKFKYDVFISYSHKNEVWVMSMLLPRLENAGLKVCIDSRDFEPGKPALLNMQDSIKASRKTLLVLTSNWVKSEWTLFESLLTGTKDPAGLRRRTIPLRLEECKLPEFISMLTWIDFTRADKLDFSWQQLLAALVKSSQRKSKQPGKSLLTSNRIRVRLLVDGEISNFDQSQRIDLVSVVAELLEIEKAEVEILRVIAGSVVVEIEIPYTAGEKLLKLSIYDKGRLSNYGIKVLHIEMLPPPGNLPASSRMPHIRNALFTGRIEELHSLANALLYQSSESALITQAVQGMGGIGKTQLAVEFAYRYGRYYQGIHWLNLVDPTTLDSEIALCGREMALENWPDDQPSQIILTLHEWKTNGPRLLILDNFEDVAGANAVLPRLMHSNLRLLITSRRTDWPTTIGLSSIPLDIFNKEESLAFLKRSLKKRDDKEDDLNTLAARLGYLPLALELAARYLNDHPRLQIYLYLEQTKLAFDHPSMKEWRKDLPAPTQHDLDLQRTFALSWKTVKDEITRKIFQMAGYLAPNTPIPLEVFEKALEISTETCDACLSLLYGLGLLKQSENGQPAIHPLLAEYARSLDQETSAIRRLAVTLSANAKETNNRVDLTSKFSLYTPIFPHVHTVAEYAEKAKLETAGNLWNSFGYHSHRLADYSSAKIAFESALHIDEIALSENLPRVATILNNLGWAKKDLKDLNGAKTEFNRALRIDKTAFGVDHPRVGRDFNNLGWVLKDLGKLKNAKEAFERALHIDEAAFGVDDLRAAIDVNNLGLVLKDLGKLDEAKIAFERALSIFEQHFGKNHPKVATVIGNQGVVMQAVSDVTGVEADFQEHLGQDQLNIATVVDNLGWVLKDLGDLNGAKAAYERALRIDKAACGNRHPKVAIDMKDLGWVSKDLGRLEEAKVYFEQALEIDKVAYDENHLKIAKDLNNIGWVSKDLGRLEEAKVYFEQALEIDNDNKLTHGYGPVARDMNNIGWVLKDLGKLEEAKVYFERALEIDINALGKDHPWVALDFNNLGWVLKDLGDLGGAKAAFEQALQIDKAAFRSEHVAIDLNNLGLVLKDLGDLNGAKAAFEEALQIDEAAFGKNHSKVASDNNNLGLVLKNMGRLEEARIVFEQALFIFEQHFDSHHPNIEIVKKQLRSLNK